MAKINESNLIEFFLGEVPELTPIYQHHLDLEYLEEVYNTLWLSHVGRYAVELFSAHNLNEVSSVENPEAILIKLFDTVETALGLCDEAVLDIIMTCFLEELPK